MTPSFNLLEEPWVPCISLEGTPIELSLRDALIQAHELRELHGESPLVIASLYRLLLALLHRVFGPEGWDAWRDVWTLGHWAPGPLDEYLRQWRHRFDLFHAERPFYQAPVPCGKRKSVASLVHDVASGNNPTLFDHHTEATGLSLTPPQAARMAVAAQAFGLAGLSGLPQKFTDGACARGVVFLVQGDNLFETLALNLIRYPVQGLGATPGDDRPAWEMDAPSLPDRSVPLGYLDHLTWQNRRILLFPEETPTGVWVREMTVAPALRLAPEVRDPMKHHRIRGKRLVSLRFREGRALWRDSAALFELSRSDSQAPRALHWVAELVQEGYLGARQTHRFLALGMANHQAKVDFCRTERMPLPLEYLRRHELVHNLRTGLSLAEAAGRQLWGATRTLAKFVLSPEADCEGARQPARQDLDALTNQWAPERHYWSRLEIPFRQMTTALPTEGEQALVAWTHTLRRTAWDAFDRVAEQLADDAASLKATVRARDQLAAGLGKALPLRKT